MLLEADAKLTHEHLGRRDHEEFSFFGTDRQLGRQLHSFDESLRTANLALPFRALSDFSARKTGIGARGRSRTDTLLRAVDFLPTSAFAALCIRTGSWSGARLHHNLSVLGARRLLSTPSQLL